MASIRILVAGGGTGGHLVPALNLAAALRRAEPEAAVLLLGARRGVESQVLPEAGWPYRLLPMEPLRRARPWRNWRLLASLPGVVKGLRRAFREHDPQLVLGTGGYASGPAVAWALAAGRPTALQEQNVQPGLVTRLLAPRVDQIHLGWPEARERLRPGPGTEVFCLGNPVAAEAARTPFEWPAGRTVLVFGGSQGARGLNERLLGDLEGTAGAPWPEDLHLVWVAGPAHREAVAARASRLPASGRIRVVSYIPELGARLGAADLVVARAGAMTCAELTAAGVPAVLVPLPTAAADHQSRNAAALEAAGAALRLDERELRSGELWTAVRELMEAPARRRAMAAAMAARGRPDAADRIAVELLRLARKGGSRVRD